MLGGGWTDDHPLLQISADNNRLASAGMESCTKLSGLDPVICVLRSRSCNALKRGKEYGMLRVCPVKDGRLTKGRRNADRLPARVTFAAPDVDPI